MMFDNVFSVDTGVGSCWWHISDRAVLMDVSFRQFSNNYPNYASLDNAIIFFTMMNYTSTGTLSWGIACIGVLDFGHRKKYPQALLHDSGSDM